MSNTDSTVSNSNGEVLTQEEVERRARQLSIPKAEARRMLAKKMLREDS